MLNDFVSKSCNGEKCRCGQPATKKIEETIFWDDPDKERHPFTQYVCQVHFDEVMRPYLNKNKDLVEYLTELFCLYFASSRSRAKELAYIVGGNWKDVKECYTSSILLGFKAERINVFINNFDDAESCIHSLDVCMKDKYFVKRFC